MARRLPPFELEVTRLGPRGVGEGTAPDGHPVAVRGAPPGARIGVTPTGRSKGGWTGRRTALIRPPPAHEAPRCAQFGLCGGCTLQELSLDAQRAAKVDLALRQVAEGGTDPRSARIWPVRGAPAAYGYRNRVELSFGPRRYVSEAERAANAPIEGRFLGFHAPGRFDRVVDTPRCELVSDEMNEILAAVRAIALDPEAPPPYDPHDHSGFWRHLGIRGAAGGQLCVIYTSTSPGGEPWIERIAARLGSLERTGVQWRTGDHVADVARGEIARQWGPDRIEERLGALRFEIGATSFFQTNTAGTEVLYEAVREAFAADAPGGTLYDLYCGVGSIGLWLADRFDRVLGVEENPESVQDAERNAERNGIAASFVAARVEDVLPDTAGACVVVDPPRAGLHPRVAEALAAAHWRSLVYVACNPASLGRDAAVLARAGARLTDLWVVDLFPQTGHVEAVARFERGTP